MLRAPLATSSANVGADPLTPIRSPAGFERDAGESQFEEPCHLTIRPREAGVPLVGPLQSP
jgi:hypothetical protein